MGDTNLHYLEITGHCKICNKKLAFRGPMGMAPTEPRVSPGGEEIRLPFLCEGEEERFGFNGCGDLISESIGGTLTTIGNGCGDVTKTVVIRVEK